MTDVIETVGEEKEEEKVAETPKLPANGQGETVAAEKEETSPAASAAEAPPEAPAQESNKSGSREPSQAVLDATAEMGRAAAVGPEEAQAAADRMEREALLETLSFQVPEGWLTADAAERLRAVPTAALSMMLTWLSLSWWQGYEHGRVETVGGLKRALEKASEKGLSTEKDRAAVAEVEKDIRSEQKDIAASIEGGGGE